MEEGEEQRNKGFTNRRQSDRLFIVCPMCFLFLSWVSSMSSNSKHLFFCTVKILCSFQKLPLNERRSQVSSTPVFYSGNLELKSQPRDRLSRGLLVPPGKCTVNTQIRPRAIPSTSFPIHYKLTVPSFDPA
jgi:hypothetical protein